MAAKKQEVKKLSKAEQMMAALSGVTHEFTRVNGVEPLEVYVKATNYEQYLAKVTELQRLSKAHSGENDKYSDERGLALELYDENGDYYFNPENNEDMEYMKTKIPFPLRLRLATAVGLVNSWGNIPKNSETTEQK